MAVERPCSRPGKVAIDYRSRSFLIVQALKHTHQPITGAVPLDDSLRLVSLADGRRGFVGVIAWVGAPDQASDAIDADELERRLLEMGFVEGARVEIIHEGFIGHDPICVRLDDMRVALRRREARGVLVHTDGVA